MKGTLQNLPLMLLGSLLIGLGCSGFFWLIFSFGQIPPQARLLDFFIPLLVLVFMLILIRARKEERSFHFWEGLAAGNFMLWMGGLISGCLVFGIVQFQPQIFENFVSSSIRYLVDFNRYAPDTQKAKNLPEQITALRSLRPSSMIMDELLKKVFYSFLLVPFVSIIFRRK